METIDFNKKIETLLEKAKANDSEAQDELLTWFPFFDNYYEERIDFDLYENLYEYLKKFLDDNFEFILCNHKKDMDANFILLMLKTNVYHDLFDFESWYQELYEKVDNRFDYQGDLDIFDVIRYKNKWECYDVQESYKKLLAYYGDEYYANEGYKIGPRNDLKLAIMYIKIESNNENANHILLQQADCYAFGIGVIKDVKKARNLCFELIYDFEQAYYYKYDHWYDYDYRKCNDDLINAAKIKLVSFCFLDYDVLKKDIGYMEYLGFEFFEQQKYSDRIVDIMIKLMKYENCGLDTAFEAKRTLKKLCEFNLTRGDEELVDAVMAYYNYGKNEKYNLKECLNFFGVKFEELIKNEKLKKELTNYYRDYQELKYTDFNNIYEIEQAIIKAGTEKEKQEKLSSLKQSLQDKQHVIEFYEQQIANAYQSIEELKKEIINLEKIK